MNTSITGPDGSPYESLSYSTTVQTAFFSGSIPDNSVDVQVSFNGSGFSSYQGLVRWGDGSWTFPDPSYNPDGAFLSSGVNTLQVRALLPDGRVSNTASATIKLLDQQTEFSPPTSIVVERKDESVLVSVEPPEDPSGYFRGVNFYASAFPGGGSTGYTRINVELVTDSTVIQKVSDFADSQIDINVKLDLNGNQVADPMMFRVSGSQEDENGNTLQEDFSETYEIPETATSIRYSSQLQQVREVSVYSFDHNRGNNPNSSPATVSVSEFLTIGSGEPLYYVVTAVFYDPTQMVEYETSFSAEVVASPATVTRTLGSIGTVTRQDILQQFVTSIFRSNPQIKVEAGSVLRDTVIDPFSSESERLRFVLDFYHRARTPALLLQIDDPTGSGTSVPVSSSSYKLGLKTALYFDLNSQVQDLIDSAFEAYASNFGVSRKAGTSSRGEVTFYTSVRPQGTVSIPIGTQVSGGGVVFSVIQNVSIPLSNIASYFDPVSGVYRVNAPVQSVEVGEQTNIGAGQITTVISSIGSSIRVTNSSATFGGVGGESNLSLTTRVQNRLASVDSGTKQGYKQTAAEVPGVVKANVVVAGDPLMQRDLNDSGEHKGGKVDIWVQGESLTTVTDVFAFEFSVGQDIQFEVIDIPNLKFRALDTGLSESNPIIEVLDYPSLGYEFRNVSTGEVFDLSGVQILTYNTIQLDTSVLQPSVDLTDVVLGSYRVKSGSVFTPTRQPVSGISSLEGEVSGLLPDGSYDLIRPSAPLSYGRSVLAGDFVSIIGYEDDNGNTVPGSQSTVVEDEEHVLVGSYPEFLDKLGANYITIVVKSEDGLVTYKGPNDPSGSPDYQITLGTQTTAVSITRTSASAIPSGATVLISYEHDENFTVSYSTNLMVSVTQQEVDEKKHATADVLVKEAIPVPIDIEATVILDRGRQFGEVDSSIRTNFSNFFGNLRLGDPVRQSDVIDVIEQTDGVSYVVVPLTKMVRQQGSTVVRDEISTDTYAESSILSSVSTNESVVYILTNELSAATIDGGGGTGDFKGVFQSDIGLVLLSAGSTIGSLGASPGLSYIVGSEGKSIEGYSDDATLESQGYTTEASKVARRKAITANRVLVSLPPGDSPISYRYSVTYVVGQDSGSKNIEPGAAEYCESGSLIFTYDEDR